MSFTIRKDGRRSRGALRHAGWSWVLLGWICYSVVEILATVRWQILLRIQGIRISWLRAAAIVIIGLSISFCLVEWEAMP
jgi:uncharacterized membrane protein YbhN (UPF0104 family)